MATDDPPPRDESESGAERVRDALFAADLKRLVRASDDGDIVTTEEIRSRYITE